MAPGPQSKLILLLWPRLAKLQPRPTGLIYIYNAPGFSNRNRKRDRGSKEKRRVGGGKKLRSNVLLLDAGASRRVVLALR